MPGFYLAGRVSRSEELLDCVQDLLREGHWVTSRWLFLDQAIHANRSLMSDEARANIAANDLHDIRSADVVILFSEYPGNMSNGGRLVEFGYALGRHKECWVVGPMENLFLCLPNVKKFPDWEAVIAYVKERTWVDERFAARRAAPVGAEDAGAVPGAVRRDGHPV